MKKTALVNKKFNLQVLQLINVSNYFPQGREQQGRKKEEREGTTNTRTLPT